MSPKRPNIPVAIPNDDGSSTIVGSEELRARRGKPDHLGRPRIEAIERIFGHLVDDKNREALCHEWAKFNQAYIDRVISKGRNWAPRKRAMGDIARHSAALLELLSRDRLLRHELWSLPVDEIQSQLRALYATVSEQLPTPPDAIKLWCALELADIYKRCAAKEPTITNPPLGGNISGEFVDFVQRVGRETTIKISLGTIEKAIKARRREIKRGTANKG